MVPNAISVPFKQLANFLKDFDADFTPMILDPSGRSDTFLTYANPPLDGIILNLKSLVVRGISEGPQVAAESLRVCLVNSMKFGRPAILSFSDSAFDLTEPLERLSLSTEVVLKASGKALKDESVWKGIVKEEDMQPYGVFVCHPDFRVICTSNLKRDEYEDFMEDYAFAKFLLPIHVMHDSS